MPRAKKTSSGVPGQPVEAIRGQEYGKGVEQEALQRAMPAPKQPNVAETMPTQSVAPEQNSPEEQQAAVRPPMDLNALREQLNGVGGLLRQPDERPDVPFTSTLSDPGAAMRLGIAGPTNRTGEFMRELSRRTGDSMFADLAARAGL